MAECKSCGKTYFSKKCPHCSNELADKVLGRTKKKSFLALIITLLIFTSIGLISYVVAEFITNQKALENANKQASLKKQRRIELQNEKERLAQQYRYQQKKNQYKSRYSSSSTTYKPREKSYRHDPIEKKIIKKTYQPRAQPKEKKIVKKYAKKTKTYHRYSKSIKLKSSSRIKTMSDNRLISNAPIYGTYTGGLFINPICKKKEIRDTHLYNDCYIETLPSKDRLYFKKSWMNDFKRYRSTKNKKIECDYSKKHGIMHDCKIWNS